MLSNLTKKLVESNIKNNEAKLFIEAVVIPSQMSKIERYSMISEPKDCTDIIKILGGVEFKDTDTFEDRKEVLYSSCMNYNPLQENVGIDKTNKTLTMTKEDFAEISSLISSYKKSSSASEKNGFLNKIKRFVREIDRQLSRVDSVDAFIYATCEKLFKTFCPNKNDKYIKSPEKDSMKTNINKIIKNLK